MWRIAWKVLKGHSYRMDVTAKREKILTVLLSAGILLFLVLIGITNLFHFNYCINSDNASDAILGRLIWESKQIIPDSWYIAEETRLICTPNIAALFYGLTKNMVLAEGLACCTMTILILASVLYFGRMLHFQRREQILFGFLCLILPGDYVLLELSYLFASYYAIHVVILFFTLGVYLEGLRDKSLKWKKMAAGVLFALIFGLQGARGILVIYGPLFGMMVIRNLYDLYCGKKKEKPDVIISLWTVVLLAVSFLGMLFPISIGQEFSRNIRNGFSKLCFVVVPDMIKAMGLDDSRSAVGRICAALLMLAVIVLLVDMLYRMCRKQELETAEWGFLILCSSPVVSALMVAFTTVDSTERYYFLFTYVMAYAPVLCYRKLKKSPALQSGMRICVSLVIAVIMILTISIERLDNLYLPILKAKEPPQSESFEVVCFLEENDFKLAYSTFENANMMTALSNGKVQVAAVATVEKMDVCKWITSTNWYVPNVPYEARTAYVIPESEMGNFGEFLAVHESDMRLETQIGRFFIYSSDYNFSCLESE